MQLFPEERVLTSSNDHVVILTTHRIRSIQSPKWGQQHVTSILLEKVSAIQMTSVSHPALLVLAGVFGIGALIGLQQSGAIAPLCLTLMVVVVIIYFGSRKQICRIVADCGTKLEFVTVGMKKETLTSFIDLVETTVFNRRKSIISISSA